MKNKSKLALKLSYLQNITLCEKCPYSEFSSPYFQAFGRNTDYKNSEDGQFSRSVKRFKIRTGQTRYLSPGL